MATTLHQGKQSNMHKAIRLLLPFVCATLLALNPVATAAQQPKTMSANKEIYRSITPEPSRELQIFIDEAARDVLGKWKERGIKDENLAITLIDLSREASYPQASFRGDAAIYPASVVKMFYLVAAHQQMEDGKLKDTPELRRAMKDMIVDSSNDATHYVLDALTDTTSGVELPEAEMRLWSERRNGVNRYFAARGFTNININQKPWCEGPYGRDRMFVTNAKASALKDAANNRNMLTTDAAARLLAEIATGRAITSARSREMMELMKRDPYLTGGDMDDQARGFTGRAVNGATGGAAVPGVRLWSKAGWTSTTRHDAAYLELPNGKRFVLVTYTTNQANEKDIIPTVARRVMDHFGEVKGAAKVE